MDHKISQQSLYRSNSSSVETLQCSDTIHGGTIKVYKVRFWMLCLFSTLSMLCGMLFPMYASMANVTMCFYGVTAEHVNWTCLIFMVVYIVLVFPVSWMIGKVGLRVTVTIGSLCNTISSAVQFASLSPDTFPFAMLASFFGSLSNVFVLAIPPILAATWFPSSELSRACAMGVFGNQLGVALGYIFSPLLIDSDCSNKELIADGKWNVAVISTTVNAVILLLIIITFQKEPRFPPSIAQAEKKNVNESYLHSAWSMAKNINFVLVFIMYGLIVGTYFAVITNLNNLLIRYFPNENVAIGWMGLLIIVAGLVGSIIAGFILDYTHKFKETSTGICLLSFIFYVVFSCLIETKTLWVQFVTVSVFGFFLTSFLPVGFEYGIEVTYPESEITSAGLLNTSTMLFGLIITELSSYALQELGSSYANGVLSAALLIGTIISSFITKNYRRSQKNKEGFKPALKETNQGSQS